MPTRIGRRLFPRYDGGTAGEATRTVETALRPIWQPWIRAFKPRVERYRIWLWLNSTPWSDSISHDFFKDGDGWVMIKVPEGRRFKSHYLPLPSMGANGVRETFLYYPCLPDSPDLNSIGHLDGLVWSGRRIREGHNEQPVVVKSKSKKDWCRSGNPCVLY